MTEPKTEPTMLTAGLVAYGERLVASEDPGRALHNYIMDPDRAGLPFVYWIGNLAEDRTTIYDDGTMLHFIQRDPGDRVARMAWNAYEAGNLCLTQRRLAPNLFAYIATKRREKWRP